MLSENKTQHFLQLLQNKNKYFKEKGNQEANSYKVKEEFADVTH